MEPTNEQKTNKENNSNVIDDKDDDDDNERQRRDSSIEREKEKERKEKEQNKIDDENAKKINNPLIVVFGIAKYNHESLTELPNVKKDCEIMYDLWKGHFNYDVLIEKEKFEWNYDELFEFLEKAKEKCVKEKYDGIFVVVCCYTIHYRIITTDNKYLLLSKIYTSWERSEYLKDKPKIFFFQAYNPPRITAPIENPTPVEDRNKVYPPPPCFCILYSMTKPHMTPNEGGQFLQIVCKLFKQDPSYQRILKTISWETMLLSYHRENVERKNYIDDNILFVKKDSK